MRPRLERAFEVVLPSGARGRFTAHRRSPPARDLPDALRGGAVESSVDLPSAPLADAHVVEAIAAALGAIESPSTALTCRNCGRSFEVDGARHLPLEPLLDPTGHPYEVEVDRARTYPLPRPVTVGRRAEATTFTLARRTLRDRVLLEEILAGVDDLPLAPPLVRAMGIAALGDVVSPSAICRALRALDDEAFDEAWDAIARAWDEQHYPARLLAPVGCPHCGARHDVEVPSRRPFPFGRAPAAAHDFPLFPPLAAFRTRAAEITREVLLDSGLGDMHGLEVIVDEGVPPCDDGGEPLLGSYTPTPEADGDVRLAATSPFVIAFYYRTFRSMYADEPYDVDAEIRETLAHELEHHHGFLRGSDPLDEEERAEIDAERLRVLGKNAHTREIAESVSWLAGDLVRFGRATWPLWTLALVALLILIASSR